MADAKGIVQAVYSKGLILGGGPTRRLARGTEDELNGEVQKVTGGP